MYLFIDTETTGLPDKSFPSCDLRHWPRIVQLAYAVYDEGEKLTSSAGYLIKPCGFEIPPESQRVHGISTEKALRDGVEADYALSELCRAIDGRKFIIGHNLDFDRRVIESEARRSGLDMSFVGQLICTMKQDAVINLCQLPSKTGYGYKWPRLIELHIKLFGCEFDGAHDALADTLACAKCFFKLKEMGLIKEL